MLRKLLLSPSLTTPLLRQSLLLSSATTTTTTTAIKHFCTTSSPPFSSLPNEPQQPTSQISIDRSNLCNPTEHEHLRTNDSDLVKHLKSIIKFRGGPISVAEYMEEVLTNPKDGFYINRDVFGEEGDFITSPEVSQMFGEMVGVWTMCLWEQMGQPEKVNLIELGPGRGTLMADLLRGASKFEKFTNSLDIHMVECSPTLKKLQYNTLNCKDRDNNESNGYVKNVITFSGTPISWHATLEEVPIGGCLIMGKQKSNLMKPVMRMNPLMALYIKKDFQPLYLLQMSKRTSFIVSSRGIDRRTVKHNIQVPTVIIGHEFYDALPVHQFQRASRGWSEKMVDVVDDSSFRFVLSPQPTPATLYLIKRCKWAATEKLNKLDRIEICPKGMELTHEIAKRVGSDGGGALIIDYGRNGIVTESLQAIRKHKFVDILDNPGSADLSAYVDFPSIRHSAEEASEDISIHGPISQSQFLGSLGINFRAEALLQNCTVEQADSLRNGYWQLVGDGEAPFWEGPKDKSPIGMGTRYMVMAIVNKKQGVPAPFH